MKWWKVHSYLVRIDPVEVIKETAEFVILAPDEAYKQTRRAKKSDEYFPTFSAARAALMKRYSDTLNRLAKSAEEAKGKLDKAFMLEEPK